MRAIILAGGYGSRLAPLTKRIAKSLVPVAGQPVIAHLLQMISEAKITKAIISLNKNQSEIEDYFGDGSDFGVSVEYHYEHSQSDLDKPGAVGALNNLVKELGPEESFVIGGDNIVYGLNLDRMLEFHKAKKASATLALYELSNPRLVEMYGICKTNADGLITHFQEKPSQKEAVSRLASTAVYIMSETFLRQKLPEYLDVMKGKADRIGDLWHHYLDSGELYGFPFSGVWGDANSCESYLETHQRVMEFQGERKDVDDSANIAQDATLVSPVVIGPGCKVGSGATIGPFTSLSENVEIGNGSTVSKSIVFERVRIGNGCGVENAVLDADVILGDNCRVEKLSMLGQGVVLESGARVLTASKIWPNISLDSNSVVRGCIKNE